jgi:hypothetical protein
VVAARFLTALKAAIEPLRDVPVSGPAREHFAPGLRVWFFRADAI